jgi:hypothetical protein
MPVRRRRTEMGTTSRRPQGPAEGARIRNGCRSGRREIGHPVRVTDAPLEYLDGEIVFLRDGSYRWLRLHRFRCDLNASDPKLLSALLSHVRYQDRYLQPDTTGVPAAISTGRTDSTDSASIPSSPSTLLAPRRSCWAGPRNTTGAKAEASN